MKDDYAYSGWLPAGTGRVEGSAKWCNDAENELKGTGLQSEYLALDLSNTPDCLPCLRSRVTPHSSGASSTPKTCTSTSSLWYRAMLMSDPAAFDR